MTDYDQEWDNLLSIKTTGRDDSISDLTRYPYEPTDYRVLEMLAGECRKYYPSCTVRVISVKNRFFGESITVAGLVTGQDLISQLEGNDLGDVLLIPQNMLRSGENVFLDDITTEEVSERLRIPVRVTGNAGRDLLSAFLGTEAYCQSFHNEYEPGF